MFDISPLVVLIVVAFASQLNALPTRKSGIALYETDISRLHLPAQPEHVQARMNDVSGVGTFGEKHGPCVIQ
jgi:hypothetical protein